MIIGTGIDIIEVERVAEAMKRKGFAERVFSVRELDFLKSRNMNSQTTAGGFAAKEAVSKALGTGFGLVSLREIEILHDEAGKPFVELCGGALAHMAKIGGKRLHVSISHVASTAVAQAIIEE